MGWLRVGHHWATSFSLSCIGGGNGNPLQCSCLENPRDGGAWWAAVYGVTQSWTRLKWISNWTFFGICFLWDWYWLKQQLKLNTLTKITPVLNKIQTQRSLIFQIIYWIELRECKILCLWGIYSWPEEKDHMYTCPVCMLCYAKSLQSCPTLCDPIDGSPPGSPVPGIL